MTSLVPVITIIDGQPFVSSLDIAERFEKPHYDVLKAIRKFLSECPAEFGQGKISLSSYLNEQGKEQPMYRLTRDAFSLVTMGFTGKEALTWKIRYIEAFKAMEEALLESFAKPAFEAKPKRKLKVLPAPPDPLQVKIDTLLGKAVFYAKEINEVEKQVADLLSGNYLQNNPGPHNYSDAGHRFAVKASCATSHLWAAIQASLDAVRESIKAELAKVA